MESNTKLPLKRNKKTSHIDSLKKGTFKNITPQSPKEARDICSPLLCDIWDKGIVQKRPFQRILKTQM